MNDSWLDICLRTSRLRSARQLRLVPLLLSAPFFLLAAGTLLSEVSAAEISAPEPATRPASGSDSRPQHPLLGNRPFMDTVYKPAVYENAAGEMLPYRLAVPRELQPETRYPLVIFLHGAGERGDDNIRQAIHGLPEMSTDSFRRRHATYVLAPQCPADAKWVDKPWDAAEHTQDEQPAAPLRLVREVLDALCAQHPIDRQRIYAVGLSMGGYGVWDLAQREPQLLAAAIPICGGGDPQQAPRIAKLPLWAFHGADDLVVRPERSREMVAAMQAAGGTPIYTEYEGVGHDSWSPTFANRCVWDWLFAQRRVSNSLDAYP